MLITVNAYEPPEGAAVLVVNLLTANQEKLGEIGRFSVHPNAPFKVSEGVEPQRFLFSLADHAESLVESEIGVEVGFDSSQEDVRGGMAAIAFEIVDIAPPAKRD